MDKDDEDTCRFYEMGTETTEHILYESKALSRKRFQRPENLTLKPEHRKASAPLLILAFVKKRLEGH